MTRNIWGAKKELWPLYQLKADVSDAHNATTCWIHLSQTPGEWLSHILLTQSQHVSKSIFDSPENGIWLFISQCTVGGYLHSVACDGCKILFQKVSSQNTLYHSGPSFFFFLHFNRGKAFEKSYIKIPERLQDNKMPHQRAKVLQTPQKSQNKTQRSMSCTACPEAISSKEARSALCPLLINLSSVCTSHPTSV